MKKILCLSLTILAVFSLSACGKKSSNSKYNYIGDSVQQSTKVTPTTVAQLQQILSSGRVANGAVYQLTATATENNSWKTSTDGKTTTVLLKGASSPLPIAASTDDANTWTEGTQLNLTLRIDLKKSGNTTVCVPTVTTSSIISGGTTLQAKQAALTQQLLDALNNQMVTINKGQSAQLVTNISQTSGGAYNEFTITLNSGFNQLAKDKIQTSVQNLNTAFVNATNSLNANPLIHYVIAGQEVAVNQAPTQVGQITFEGSLK